MGPIFLMIPIWYFPWKSKAEIARLQAIANERDGLKQALRLEQEYHAQTRGELNTTREKIANVTKWVVLTHGLSGLQVAEGKTVDLLKRVGPKIHEAKNSVPVVPPAPG